MLSLDDIHEILRTPLIGVIPESESVLQASNQGTPAIHLQGTDVAEAYKDVVAPLPRRGQAHALHRSGEAELVQARLRRQVMGAAQWDS